VASSLDALMNIEVKNTERRDLFYGTHLISDKKLLHSNLDQTYSSVSLSPDIESVITGE
jgi:hypothetical protein